MLGTVSLWKPALLAAYLQTRNSFQSSELHLSKLKLGLTHISFRPHVLGDSEGKLRIGSQEPVGELVMIENEAVLRLDI